MLPEGAVCGGVSRFHWRVGVLAGIVAARSAAAAEGDPQAIPALTAHVTDLTGTLDATQKQTLESELTALEKAKGAQLGVLMVPTTAPEDIAQYGIRVADAWKLGRKGTDDGAILDRRQERSARAHRSGSRSRRRDSRCGRLARDPRVHRATFPRQRLLRRHPRRDRRVGQADQRRAAAAAADRRARPRQRREMVCRTRCSRHFLWRCSCAPYSVA